MPQTLLSSAEGLSSGNLQHQVLRSALLQAQTVNQLVALIVDYTHEEIMQAFDELPSLQQKRIQQLWHRCSTEILI